MPRFPALLACVAAAALAAACGGGSSDNGNGNGNGNGDVVIGAARLGWDQQAADATELARLHFVIYVDGTRSELASASCSSPAGGGGFPCSALLPTMSSGQHTIELASYFVAGSILEGPKSAPLVITVSATSGVVAGAIGMAAPPDGPVVAAPTVARETVLGDGTRLMVVPVAGAVRPTALAVARDGTLVVGDGQGVVRVVRAGVVVGQTALAAEDVVPGEGRGILDLALDPEFERTRLVYVLDTAGVAAPSFRLSRFREVGGQLGERAVLASGVRASAQRPSGALAFGPDARLYVALDDGGEPESAGHAASYNGKLLRLSADGTIAGDRANATPIHAANLHAPRSLAWDPVTASFWTADAATGRAARVRGRGRPAPTTSYRLPLAAGPAALAVYRGALIPALEGDLLVAPIEDAAYLLRAGVSDSGQATLAFTERIAITGFGSIHLVEVGADGAIYVGTDDAVLRMAPR